MTIVDSTTGEIVSDSNDLAISHEAHRLALVEGARHQIEQAKTITEVKGIRDKAEALRMYLKQQQAGLDAQNAAARIKLWAERKAGEMLKEMEKNKGAQGNPGGRGAPIVRSQTDTAQTLEEIGLNKSQSSRYQLIAELPPEVFEQKMEEIDGEGKELTSAGMQRVAREYRDEQSLKDSPPLPSSKYRVIYADPPWKYGNTMPDYFTEQANYYPLMTIEQICAMPVKAIADDNAVLFLWVTSPILEESFAVIKAWGFQYKSSFIWDKDAPVMGHYNSVQHELLLVCVRGSCQPDVKKLFDSVQTIKRGKHSEKPEHFREIIDTIYPNGRRIELFARCDLPQGWDGYGNELPRQQELQLAA